MTREIAVAHGRVPETANWLRVAPPGAVLKSSAPGAPPAKAVPASAPAPAAVDPSAHGSSWGWSSWDWSDDDWGWSGSWWSGSDQSWSSSGWASGQHGKTKTYELTEEDWNLLQRMKSILQADQASAGGKASSSSGDGKGSKK